MQKGQAEKPKRSWNISVLPEDIGTLTPLDQAVLLVNLKLGYCERFPIEIQLPSFDEWRSLTDKLSVVYDLFYREEGPSQAHPHTGNVLIYIRGAKPGHSKECHTSPRQSRTGSPSSLRVPTFKGAQPPPSPGAVRVTVDGVRVCTVRSRPGSPTLKFDTCDDALIPQT